MNPVPRLSAQKTAWSPAVVLCSWFGAGYLPVAPGSWGSLAALPFAWIALDFGGSAMLAGLTGAIFLLGWAAAASVVRGSAIRDPGWIVIDEVAGQWLTLLAAPANLADFAIGFAAFRCFDIVKPFPVGLADRRLKGGFGIMADDVLAALYAGAVLWLCHRLLGGLR